MADKATIKNSIFKNSKAASKYFEPIFLNHFEVIFTPPASLTTGYAILTEHVKKITGLPELTPVGFVEQHFRWAKRTYAKPKPEDTTAELELEFEINLNDAGDNYIYNILRAWADLIFDPITGKMGLKKDYVGSIVVNVFKKNEEIFRTYKFNPVFMIDPLKKMDLDYTSEEVFSLTAKFKADWWAETRGTGYEEPDASPAK